MKCEYPESLGTGRFYDADYVLRRSALVPQAYNAALDEMNRRVKIPNKESTNKRQRTAILSAANAIFNRKFTAEMERLATPLLRKFDNANCVI